MKKISIIIFALCSSMIYAQQVQVEPTFESDGDAVAVTTYYEDGSVKEEGFYKNKQLHGEWNLYNREGDKITRAYYKNGQKTGKWIFLNNGVVTEVDYDDNRITNIQKWNKNQSIAIN